MKPAPAVPLARTDWSGGARSVRTVQLVAVFVVALVPRLMTVGKHVTTDEGVWMSRTGGFSDALLDLDLARMTASEEALATMPGVTTMWLGSVGRLGWSIASELGLVDDASFESLSGLAAAQSAVAVATALLITLIAWLVHRWAGWGAGAVVAVLLVGEPWLVGLGSVLHTDELTALFGTAGLLLLALAFDVPNRVELPHPVLAAGAAGVLLVLSPLTKVLGLGFGVGAALVIAFALWRDRGCRDDHGGLLLPLRGKQLVVAAAAAVVTIPFAWPALVANPSSQWSLLLDSIGIGDAASAQFFLGERTDTPGWAYYAVALPFRMTPWFLLSLVVALPVGLATRATRSRVIWTLVWMLPVGLAIAGAAKQFDRYGLVVLVPLAVTTGVALGPPLERFLATYPPLRGVASVVALTIAIYVGMVSPWGLLYFNPALGGGERADDVLLIGWGEGAREATRSIEELEDGDCSGVTVGGVRRNAFGTRSLPSPLSLFGVPCSTPPAHGVEPDYVVAYINAMQRMSDAELDEVLAGRDQVETIEIRGIPVATIYR